MLEIERHRWVRGAGWGCEWKWVIRRERLGGV